jgi:hypothetical protein
MLIRILVVFNMENSMKIISLMLSFLLPSYFVHADLIPIEDTVLGKVDGEGVGIVLENFIYNAGESVNGGGTFEISGLETSNDEDVVIEISQFYIAASGSNNGRDLSAVNIGRLTNPFNIELRDGNDADIGVSNKAVFEFSAPKIANGSRISERPDIGIRYDLDINGTRHQSLETHIDSLSIDGSYIRLWGGNGRMEGELALNVVTPSLEFFACDAGGINCGTPVEFQNVDIKAELGSGEFQPVTFEVNSDGHFNFAVGSLENKCATNSGGGCVSGTQRNLLIDYYNNGPTTNVFIGNVSVGGQDFGSTTINNLQIQYLEVTSHDL